MLGEDWTAARARRLLPAREDVRESLLGRDRHFRCRCAGCGMLSTVVPAEQLASHEPEH